MNFIPKAASARYFFKNLSKLYMYSCNNQIYAFFLVYSMKTQKLENLHNWKNFVKLISFNLKCFFLIFWLIVKIWWMFFRITPSFAWHFWWNMNGHLKLFFLSKKYAFGNVNKKLTKNFFIYFSGLCGFRHAEIRDTNNALLDIQLGGRSKVC